MEAKISHPFQLFGRTFNFFYPQLGEMGRRNYPPNNWFAHVLAGCAWAQS
jgi:hypothetical protein